MNMTLFGEFENRIRAALSGLEYDLSGLPEGLLDRIGAEPPRDEAHGDIASNVAMVLAKPLGVKPRDLAARIALLMEPEGDIAAVEVAGPGFLNFRMHNQFWIDQLAAVLEAGDRFGWSPAGSGQKLNVEYVSANPTGPMHVGHCRGAVVGDAIASLMEAVGNSVTREYYVNDGGVQVDLLAQSVFLRYRQALGEEIGEIPKGYYPGDYLVAVGEGLCREFGDSLLSMSQAEWLPVVRDRAVAEMMKVIRKDLADLGITHDVFFSERSLNDGDRDRVAESIETLRQQNRIYVGRLPPPKGQLPDDWEDRDQTLFRSTEFGDDVDRPLLKSDGSYTYFASDIAYHYDKILRGFDGLIDVLGADHGGYAKRMCAAVDALSQGRIALEIQYCQLVRLFRGGEPVKMSKRSGDLITVKDVVDEVGPDAVRFMMLYRKADAPLDFDFKSVTEQSKDNPVFYVQYAHARTESVRRQAAEELPDLSLEIENLAASDLNLLTDPHELKLIRMLADFPRILHMSAAVREPHRIAYYLYELAGAFHAHWNRGKESPNLRFINAGSVNITGARLALVSALGIVIRSGLKVLGVNAPDEMR